MNTDTKFKQVLRLQPVHGSYIHNIYHNSIFVYLIHLNVSSNWNHIVTHLPCGTKISFMRHFFPKVIVSRGKIQIWISQKEEKASSACINPKLSLNQIRNLRAVFLIIFWKIFPLALQLRANDWTLLTIKQSHHSVQRFGIRWKVCVTGRGGWSFFKMKFSFKLKPEYHCLERYIILRERRNTLANHELRL